MKTQILNYLPDNYKNLSFSDKKACLILIKKQINNSIQSIINLTN